MSTLRTMSNSLISLNGLKQMTPSLQLQHQHIREKENLSNLNERLAYYVQVRSA